MTKNIDELCNSGYHQQLGQKMCAAFIAQQQGISLNTALGKVPEPIGDVWLIVAEFARRSVMETIDVDCLSKSFGNLPGRSCNREFRLTLGEPPGGLFALPELLIEGLRSEPSTDGL